MLYRHVNIEAIAGKTPPEIITSADIEAQLAPVYRRLKLPEGRLELMTGIRERRLWPRGSMPSEAAAAAGAEVLARSGVKPGQIGALINCSVSRDCLEPATATIVHAELGLPPSAPAFDISNACLGILTGMIAGANMIELGQADKVLLVSGENSRALLESTLQAMNRDPGLTRQSIKPYFASLTIGSGAVAVILSRREGETGPGHRLFGGASLSATEYNVLCRGNADKGMADGQDVLMNTDSEELLRRGVETAKRTWDLFRAETGWTDDSVGCYCTHQVGSGHRRLLFDSLGLDLTKDFPTIENRGNTGSVSCPLTVALAEEAGALRPGMRLAMLGIGSGINCTILGVEW
jgi:3-oxoacyl-[acyl-carrier-protein] synthase-3